jgi:hypothetical protein
VWVSQVGGTRRAGTYRKVHFLLSDLYDLMMLAGGEGGSVSGAQLTLGAQRGVAAACCARIAFCVGASVAVSGVCNGMGNQAPVMRSQTGGWVGVSRGVAGVGRR